jgi:hypothetical protein
MTCPGEHKGKESGTGLSIETAGIESPEAFLFFRLKRRHMTMLLTEKAEDSAEKGVFS